MTGTLNEASARENKYASPLSSLCIRMWVRGSDCRMNTKTQSECTHIQCCVVYFIFNFQSASYVKNLKVKESTGTSTRTTKPLSNVCWLREGANSYTFSVGLGALVRE